MARSAEELNAIKAEMARFYPRFSAQEYAHRYARIRELMGREGVDVFLIYGDAGHCYMNQANVRYVANYADHQYNYVVFPLDGPLTLFMSIPNMQPGAKAMSVIDDVRWSLGSRRDMAAAVAMRLEELGLGAARVGIVGPDSVRMPTIPHHHYETFRQRLPNAELRFLSRQFEALRRVQSSEEVEWLQRGAAFTDRAMAAMVGIIHPGVREYELYGAADGAYLPLGGHLMFQIISSTSMHRPRMPHPAPWASERPLAEGDIIMTEISAAYFGYAGQIIRAIALGEPPAIFRELFSLTRTVHDEVVAVLRPGNTERDVIRVARRIADAGYTSLTPIVHGWGLALSEPYIGLPASEAWWTEGVVFEENQTLMIEPNATTRDLTTGIVIGNLHRVASTGGVSYQHYPLEFIVK